MKIKLNQSNKLIQAGVKIIKAIESSGFKAFFVGGSVRDLILKRELDNVDIATEAKPSEVEAVLNKEGLRTKGVGKKFGTILTISENQPIEITTFRSEGRYSDKRHPDEVTFVKDYQIDAKRRDFTINAMYLNVDSEEVLDIVNGLKDLDQQLIRFVGKATDRIDEDPLRMLRAVRFSTQLNFKLEKNTFAAIKTRAKLIQGISGERIKNELDKILLSKNKLEGIRLLDSIGLLQFLIPAFPKLKTLDHNSKTYHLEGNIFEHTLLVINELSDLNLIYAGLFHDLGKVNTKKRVFKKGQWVNSFYGHQAESARLFNEFAKRLRFPRKDQKKIEWLILHHDDRINFPNMKLINKIKYILNPLFEDVAKVWMADSRGNLRLDDKGNVLPGTSPTTQNALALKEALSKKGGVIKGLANGNKILKYTKLKPGPQINKLILKIIEKIYLGEIKNENDLKKYLQKN